MINKIPRQLVKSVRSDRGECHSPQGVTLRRGTTHCFEPPVGRLKDRAFVTRQLLEVMFQERAIRVTRAGAPSAAIPTSVGGSRCLGNLFEETATTAGRPVAIAALSRYGLCSVADHDDKVPNRIAGKRVYAVHTTAFDLGPFAVVGIEGPWFPPGVGERLNMGYLLYPEPLIERQIQTWQRLARGS